MLAGFNRTLDEWLCDSFAELIEEMELWKWDDATGHFWSRLAKVLQQSNILVTWAEQLDSRLASVHTTGKMSWAVATRSTRECKMRIERIGGSRLKTDSEVWGLDQTTWELMLAGEAAMRKSIPALRQAGYESVSDLPRIQQNYREKALVVIPPRICATSNGEQRAQVLIPVVQGLSQKQRQLMQQYFELVDWQGLKLPSAKRRQRHSLKKNERSVEVWKDRIRLKKEFATLGEELPPAEFLPSKRKKQSPDPTKRDASKEEFGRRSLAGGNIMMWVSFSCLLTFLESLDKNDPEMGTDSVARQMHHKIVQHYWVSIVKQQVTGGVSSVNVA